MSYRSWHRENGDALNTVGGTSILKHLQLFRSKEYQCGEEILTIAAMTAVQVRNGWFFSSFLY